MSRKFEQILANNIQFAVFVSLFIILLFIDSDSLLFHYQRIYTALISLQWLYNTLFVQLNTQTQCFQNTFKIFPLNFVLKQQKQNILKTFFLKIVEKIEFFFFLMKKRIKIHFDVFVVKFENFLPKKSAADYFIVID